MDNTKSSVKRITLEGRNISTLQYLLKLAHSDDFNDQQKAAVELSKFVSGTVFPAVSFGPLAHALCRLVPSESNTIATYAARAVKLLLLDDALRTQAVGVGIPRVVVEATQYWSENEDVPALRELMGALQTLTWDKATAQPTIESGAVFTVVELLTSIDMELQVLALAVIANLLAYVDTLLLENGEAVGTFSDGIDQMLEIAKSKKGAPRYYSVAGLANACAHPLLTERIKRGNGADILSAIEKESMNNLNLTSNKLLESTGTALGRLSGVKSASTLKKYTSKWGEISSMELSLSFDKHRKWLKVCGILWICLILYLFFPLFTAER